MDSNNFNVLPFYRSIKSQIDKRWYSFGDKWPIISKSTEIIPFQIVIQKSIASVSTLHIVNCNTGADTNLGIKPIIITRDGYSIIMLHSGINTLTEELNEGLYYIYFTADSVTMYSEIFSAIHSMDNYTKISYWNAESLYYKEGEICYDNDFKYEMYIATTIGKPEYEFEEELTERAGYKFLESQISNKLYKFAFIATEPICDAMRLIRLSDYIQIESRGENYNALSFSYDVDWETQGNLASVEVEFTIDTIIQKLPSFNRRQRENFYNALLADSNEAILFDEQVVALYTDKFANANSSNLINGKLIRELDEYKSEEFEKPLFIAVDTLTGEAKKLNLKEAIEKMSGSLWSRVTTDSDGNILPVEAWYLKPINAYNIVMPGDVVANSTGAETESLPVATDYTTTGLFRAKQEGGLLYDTDAGWYVNPDFGGGQGGLDEAKLKQYLTDNNYLSLSSQLKGYKIQDKYSPITESDTILIAFGKLEKNFDNYVNLTTNQTINGVKTFNESIFSKKDIVANTTMTEEIESLPVAIDYTTTGLFRAKQGGGLLYDTNTNGWYVNPDFAGGGVNFTVGEGLRMSVSNELSVKYGTIAGTACQGNDYRLSNDRKNPYKLSWSGGEYDGSAEKTLPDFITDRNGNIKKLYGSGDNRKYLSGDGTFYSVQFDEISGLVDNYVTIGTAQTVTAKKVFKTYGSSACAFGNYYTSPHSQGHVYLLIGAGSGNCINGYNNEKVGNVYINYIDDTHYTRFDANNNFVTTGDVVANSTTNTLSEVVPVADNTTYGLVKYDNLTIKKNSSGQLYCTVQGGGSSGVAKYWRPSVNTSGVLSWTLSESESTPSSVNIKGPKGATGDTGADGQGVTYQWSGTRLRLGTINSNGYVSWGSYVDLKGPKGDPGSAGSGSVTSVDGLTGGTIQGSVKLTGNLTFEKSGIEVTYNSTKIYRTDTNAIHFYVNNTQCLQIQHNYLYANRSWTIGSDIRLKNRIGDFDDVLPSIKKIDVFRYTRKDVDDKSVFIGVSAQQVKEVYPELVAYNEERDLYGVDYATLGAVVAIGGCKELYAKYKAQQQTIDDLQSKLALLMQEVERMKGGDK